MGMYFDHMSTSLGPIVILVKKNGENSNINSLPLRSDVHALLLIAACPKFLTKCELYPTLRS